MDCLKRRRQSYFLVFAVGAAVLMGFDRLAGAERADPIEPYQGVRETTLQYVALGTPGDLLRLREAFDKTEQEIARLELEVPPEGQEQFAQRREKLNGLKDRLAEPETLLRLLDKSEREIGNEELDHLSAEGRASLRRELLARINDLNGAIGGLEKAIRFEQAEYLRILMDEKRALAKLLAARRESLLGEYAAFPECAIGDRSCLDRKLRTLCRLRLLTSEAELVPILRLIQEVGGQLKISDQALSARCENLQQESGLQGVLSSGVRLE
ncbi:MAG: hypothetical protein HY278_08215 [candidate division NC10 bacterium]|nr:hypothetical protein [candidate division NC10 bacterium]